jgi:hypothetical protein
MLESISAYDADEGVFSKVIDRSKEEQEVEG